MTIEWEPAYWSNDLLGTRVKLTNGSNEIIGVLRTLNSGDHQVLVETGGIVSLGRPGAWHVFTEKVPDVVLPTGPGYFFDCDGDPIRVIEGKTATAKFAPYTRLRPEAEVAADVLKDVRGILGGPCALLHKEVDEIAAKWATK